MSYDISISIATAKLTSAYNFGKRNHRKGIEKSSSKSKTVSDICTSVVRCWSSSTTCSRALASWLSAILQFPERPGETEHGGPAFTCPELITSSESSQDHNTFYLDGQYLIIHNLVISFNYHILGQSLEISHLSSLLIFGLSAGPVCDVA